MIKHTKPTALFHRRISVCTGLKFVLFSRERFRRKLKSVKVCEVTVCEPRGFQSLQFHITNHKSIIMKKLIIVAFVVITISSVNAQQLEWKLPTIDIPLMQGKEQKALLTLSHVSDVAMLQYEGEQYELKLGKLSRSCVVLNKNTGEQVAIAKRVLGKSSTVEFSNGKTLQVSRSGKRKARVYDTGNGSSLLIKEDKLISAIPDMTFEQVIVHSMMSFKKAQSILEDSKNNNYSYPIIIVQ
jgi:hypothetical protein